MATPLDFLMAEDDPTEAERAAALAAALRKQQSLGMLGLISGDPVLAQVGKAQISGAESQQQWAQEQGRLRDAQKERALNRALQAEESKRTAQFREAQLGMDRARLNQEAWEDVATEQGLFRMNKRTGEFRPLLGPDGQMLKGPKSQLSMLGQERLVGTLSNSMLKQLDPSGWGGAIKNQVVSRDQADHVLSLAEKAQGGGYNDLDQREMLELAEGFARLVKGGTPTQHEAASLVPPKNLQAGVAGIMEWLQNEPRGLNQKKFVEKMAHSVRRQKEVAEKIINGAKAQRVAAFQKLRELDPDQWAANVMSAGLDPAHFDERGVYKAPVQEVHEAQLDAKAQKQARINELVASGVEDPAEIRRILAAEGL